MHLLWKLVEFSPLSVSASPEQWVLDKGVGWEEIEKDGLKWSRESKRKNGRMREITSPGSCINPGNRVSKVPATFHRYFPSPGDNFLSFFLRKSVFMHCPFFWTFLEMGWRLSGVLGSLDPPYSPCPVLSLIPASSLCCVISRKQSKGICSRNVPPYLHLASAPATSCPFSQQQSTATQLSMF